jgi:hypothetical protein
MMESYLVSYVCDDLEAHMWVVEMTPEQVDSALEAIEKAGFADPWIVNLKYLAATVIPFEQFRDEAGVWEDEDARMEQERDVFYEL